MLGSKIRSWMENHIVRSRRKGNKNNNKNGQSSNLATSNTQNGHKGTPSASTSIGQNVICTGTGAASVTSTTATSSMSHQNQHYHPHNHHHHHYYSHETNPSTIGVCTSSPARRSEVSPIQSHTTSRAGWQSPQDDDSIPISPKSDHYPYRHMVKSRTSSPHQIPRKSSYTLDSRTNKTATTTPSNTMGSITTGSAINNTNTISMTMSSTINNNSSSSNFLHHNSNKINDNKNTPQSMSPMTSTTGSQMNRCLFNENKTMENKNALAVKIKNKTNTIITATASGCYDDVSIKSGLNYEKINKNGNEATTAFNNNKNGGGGGGTCTINSTNNNNNNNNNNVKNTKLNQKNDDNHIEGGGGYGKILSRTNPIQAVTQHQSRHQLSKQQQQHQQQQQLLHDQINANLMPATQITTNSNNNHLHPTQYIAQPCGGKNPIGYHPHQPAPRGRGLRGGPIISNGVTTSTQPSGRYHHVVNSLSSPESAYSTGYSTDGTSPGTHYFPKNVVHHPISMEPQSLAGLQTTTTTTSSVSRYKPFMLNKIDEATTPNGSGPNSADLIGHFHRRTESCDLGKNFNPLIDNLNNKNNGGDVGGTNNILIVKNSTQNIIYTPAAGMSPILQKNLSFQSYKGIESPSPRQRCRIRTNPWFSNAVAAAAAAGATTTDSSSSTNSNFLLSKKIELDTCSTSSGIKSSNSDAGTDDHLNKINHLSETESSSSTEREFSHKTKSSPNTMRRNKQTRSIVEASKSIAGNNNGNGNCNESDEDATLNEMMGKFDESYVYEKETDILSDSDPTDCASDLDTGQDAGDECDTDELLDIDFIDTGSIQEIIEKDGLQNTGSCSYHMIQQIVCEKRATSVASTSSQHRIPRRSRRQDVEGGSKRRKKLVRTRKKGSTESGGQASNGANSISGSNATTMSSTRSPVLAIRGCRSVGGTPVCLRRNQSEDKSRQIMTPLINRANSLTFTEIHSIRSKFLSIAESEKALLKADLEADIKYKQLIHEAETILVSLKTNGLRDVSPIPVQAVAPIVAVGPPPPAMSPRRICNLPTNKRVEMLRHCEVDLKREMGRNSTSNGIVNGGNVTPVGCTTNNNSAVVVKSAEIGATDLLNKRLEILRNETASAPNSPKPGSRFSPRKTHVSNFIIQNVSPTDLLRRKSVPAGDQNNQRRADDTMSPQLQLNGRKIAPSPPKSPTPMRRRFRSQSPRVSIDSDSDSDAETKKKTVNKFHRRHFESNGNKENNGRQTKASNKRLPPPPPPPPLPPKPNKIIEDPIYDDIVNENHKYDAKDFLNRNIIDNIKPKPPLISFRSIDIGNHNPESFYYCPQSEPLKRKIYTCSSTYDKIQKSLDMESEIPKKALLNKISLLRRERQAIKELTNASNEIMLSQLNNNNNNNHLNNNCNNENNINNNTNNNNYNIDNDNNNNVNTNNHNHNHNNNNNNIRQSGYDVSNDNANSINLGEKINNKHLLIMNTIEDIKRSLEDQSIELYGLNESDT